MSGQRVTGWSHTIFQIITLEALKIRYCSGQGQKKGLQFARCWNNPGEKQWWLGSRGSGDRLNQLLHIKHLAQCLGQRKPLISSSCYYYYCYPFFFPLAKNWRFKSRMWIIGSLGTRMNLLFPLPLVVFRYDWLIRKLCLIMSYYLSRCWNECGCSVSNMN